MLEQNKNSEKSGIGILPRLVLPIAVGIIGFVLKGVEAGAISAGATAGVQEAGIQLFYGFFRVVGSITNQDYVK